jgi:hypothetical protein
MVPVREGTRFDGTSSSTPLGGFHRNIFLLFIIFDLPYISRTGALESLCLDSRSAGFILRCQVLPPALNDQSIFAGRNKMLTRSGFVSLLLIACAVGLSVKAYLVWKEGPWELPNPKKPKTSAVVSSNQPAVSPVQPMPGTEVIISKNVFDPERGASKTKETEAEGRSMQRIRSMLLLGTAIMGPDRYAVVQESAGLPSGGPATPAESQTPRRLKIGDTVEGFNLSEIGERRIVFIKGPTRVEVPLDFFRNVEPANLPTYRTARPVGTPSPSAPQAGQPAPPVVPNVSRRPRLPAPATPIAPLNPNSEGGGPVE